MAVYVTSDLHGMTLEDFKKMLELCGFCDEDTLYVLGDVIDRRNDGGIELLCYIMESENIKMLLGNHEDMLGDCSLELGYVTKDFFEKVGRKNKTALGEYLRNGGDVTLEALNVLSHEKAEKIIKYICSLPLYEEAEVNKRSFLLVHTAPGGFSPTKKLSDYTKYELIWSRPSYDDRYYEDKTVIFGHTPTIYYGSMHKGKILHRPTWINIDTGAAYGYSAAILRLDDMREFYYR